MAVSHGALEANSTCLHRGAHVSERFGRVFENLDSKSNRKKAFVSHHPSGGPVHRWRWVAIRGLTVYLI
ncbi:DUF7563 family protein [Natronosalvus hydrolyticus]|uniref:DUF7563 family protein n=1 Tax=Natronosalvus hydrolyticus TaxID=2979988 RepID=UPI003CCC7979